MPLTNLLRSRALAVLALLCAASTSVAALPILPLPAPTRAIASITSIEAVTGGKHMLFRVRGASGGTVYLLGSVHLLSAEAGKLPPEVDSAFAHAKTIAFETSLDTVQMRAQELLTRARYTGGATLRSSLSPAGVARADTLLRAYGLTVDQLNAFKPWFVSMVMSQVLMQKAHFQAQYGVDMQLNARAKSAGMPVIGLESVDFQLGLFDSISPADQEKMLMANTTPDSAQTQLMYIKDAWLEGSTTKLDSLLNTRASESADFFATFITKRNKSWIPQIEKLLGAKDDALVVVGAAHLVGKQGVIALLKEKGYTIEQL